MQATRFFVLLKPGAEFPALMLPQGEFVIELKDDTGYTLKTYRESVGRYEWPPMVLLGGPTRG